jgi:hypothetical protein
MHFNGTEIVHWILLFLITYGRRTFYEYDSKFSDSTEGGEFFDQLTSFILHGESLLFCMEAFIPSALRHPYYYFPDRYTSSDAHRRYARLLNPDISNATKQYIFIVTSFLYQPYRSEIFNWTNELKSVLITVQNLYSTIIFTSSDLKRSNILNNTIL